MTGQEIITAFELQVSDLTELSSTEELTLLNKVYKKEIGTKPLEITKKEATGFLSTTVPYISVPADFNFLVANHNYTDRGEYANLPVIFVGTNGDRYHVVSWSDRRQYLHDGKAAYLDVRNGRIVFTVQPNEASAYSFDYHAIPDSLTLNTSPIIPSHLCPIFAHLMATEDFVLQLSDKAKSYANENMTLAKSYRDDIALWNSNLVQM